MPTPVSTTTTYYSYYYYYIIHVSCFTTVIFFFLLQQNKGLLQQNKTTYSLNLSYGEYVLRTSPTAVFSNRGAASEGSFELSSSPASLKNPAPIDALVNRTTVVLL